MTFDAARPALSVIIPTLNEADALPLLLADLAAQTGVRLEVLVSDGGSADDTRRIAASALERAGLAGRVLDGAPGRGRQLNRGAACARGEWLLFLHADSRLPDPAALTASLEALRRGNDPRLAGHFALQFDLCGAERSAGYLLLEVKARTGLPGTIHGDQGFLLNAAFFRELGGFREDLPVLEDTLLAEAVRARGGAWLLLPATLVTSARRFRSEGFAQRQTVNALLVNFALIGWGEPLRRLPGLYPPQGQTRPLQVASFLRLVDECLAELPVRKRLRIWYDSGVHVRGNAWQLLLRRRVERDFAADLPATAVPLAPVLAFRRRFDLLTGNPVGNLTAAVLVWLWFRTRYREPLQGE